MFFNMYFVLYLGHTVSKLKLGKKVIAFSGKIHWHFSLIVWVLVQSQIDVWLNPIPFLIGSIFPDADHRRAPIGRIIPLWLFFNHRGFTHSLIGLVVFSLPVLYFDLKWGCIFATGYMLHLLFDSSTPMGIKWGLGHKRKRAYN